VTCDVVTLSTFRLSTGQFEAKEIIIWYYYIIYYLYYYIYINI